MTSRPSIFVDDFKELVDSCVCFYEANKDKMSSERVHERRSRLAVFAEAFHKDCGTLTPSVQTKIEDLRNGRGLILMTAHQPNFFAYGGVFRKATLIFVLAKKLEEMLKVPVVNFFGIADQDFTDDRWVRSCQLPAVQRTNGILSIEVKLPERLMLNRMAKPSPFLLKKWRAEIEKWLNDAVMSVERLCKALGFKDMHSSSFVSTLHENFMSFWDVVEGCYERSDKYSDFNAFMMSKIVNDVWGYDTIFSRFSECQQVFVDEFSFLLARSKDYSRLLKEAEQEPRNEGIGGGVSEQEPFLVPFWYHCDCGSKVKLFLEEKGGSLFGVGNCVGCNGHFRLGFAAEKDPDIRGIASRISARAIPMGLVFFNGLMPSCYVGGVGGITYLEEARHVSNRLGIAFPPVAVWRPHDRYLGLGQVEALLELKRICVNLGVNKLSEARDQLESRLAEVDMRLGELEVLKNEVIEKLRGRLDDVELKAKIKEISMKQTEIKRVSNLAVLNHELKILENVSTVLDLIPSIIDYAVNVGLRETSNQWMRHLSENGNLSSDVRLKSALNQVMKLDCDLLMKGSFMHKN